jgi:hypothetical protein
MVLGADMTMKKSGGFASAGDLEDLKTDFRDLVITIRHDDGSFF